MEEKIKFMKEALKEAKKAYEKLEVPVGAVIVKDGKIIARAHNLKETKTDTTKHAEILAIQKASKKLESWRLLNCEMYITLEPCSMCAGAIINSRIKKIYIGALDEKTGKIVLKSLVDVNEKMQTTMVIVTHNPGIALIGDRVIKMNSGKIIEIIDNEKRTNPKDIPWG